MLGRQLLSISTSVFLVGGVAVAQTVVQSFPATPFAAGLEYDSATDTIWVVDSNQDVILHFDRVGNLLQSLPAPVPPNSGLTNPQPVGLGIDPNTGNLWIGDEGEYFFELTQNGTATGVSWPTRPEVFDLSGLAVDPLSGNIWVVQDSVPRKASEFDTSGRFLRSIDLQNVGSADPDGLAYNANTMSLYLGEDIGDQILEVDSIGTLLGSWQLGGLNISPEGLGVDTRSGRLFIADGFGGTVWEVDGIVASDGRPFLQVGALTAGAPATLRVAATTPGGLVGIGYSGTGGGPQLAGSGACTNLTVSLSSPITVLPFAIANGAGVASITVTVPAGAAGRSAWIQALDLASCQLSQGVRRLIG